MTASFSWYGRSDGRLPPHRNGLGRRDGRQPSFPSGSGEVPATSRHHTADGRVCGIAAGRWPRVAHANRAETTTKRSKADTPAPQMEWRSHRTANAQPIYALRPPTAAAEQAGPRAVRHSGCRRQHGVVSSSPPSATGKLRAAETPSRKPRARSARSNRFTHRQKSSPCPATSRWVSSCNST